MDISFVQSYQQAQTSYVLTKQPLAKSSVGSSSATSLVDRDWSRVKDFADQLCRHADKIKSGRLSRPDSIKAYMTVLELGSALHVAINPAGADSSLGHAHPLQFEQQPTKPTYPAPATHTPLVTAPAPQHTETQTQTHPPPSAGTSTETETESEESRDIPTAHMLAAPKWAETLAQPMPYGHFFPTTYAAPQIPHHPSRLESQGYRTLAGPAGYFPAYMTPAVPLMYEQDRTSTAGISGRNNVLTPCVAASTEKPIIAAASVIPQDESQSAFLDYKLVAHTKANGNMEYLMTKDVRKRHRGRRTSGSDLVCLECRATETPEWRRGPKGAKTLCNACGLQYAKKLKREAKERILQGYS